MPGVHGDKGCRLGEITSATSGINDADKAECSGQLQCNKHKTDGDWDQGKCDKDKNRCEWLTQGSKISKIDIYNILGFSIVTNTL